METPNDDPFLIPIVAHPDAKYQTFYCLEFHGSLEPCQTLTTNNENRNSNLWGSEKKVDVDMRCPPTDRVETPDYDMEANSGSTMTPLFNSEEFLILGDKQSLELITPQGETSPTKAVLRVGIKTTYGKVTKLTKPLALTRPSDDISKVYWHKKLSFANSSTKEAENNAGGQEEQANNSTEATESSVCYSETRKWIIYGFITKKIVFDQRPTCDWK